MSKIFFFRPGESVTSAISNLAAAAQSAGNAQTSDENTENYFFDVGYVRNHFVVLPHLHIIIIIIIIMIIVIIIIIKTLPTSNIRQRPSYYYQASSSGVNRKEPFNATMLYRWMHTESRW